MQHLSVLTLFLYGFLCGMSTLYANELTAKSASDSAGDLKGPIVCLSETIPKNTIWNGEVHIPQRVTVEVGATLTIEPGTVVRFAEEKGMWVNGNIVAVGTKERPILFSIIGEKKEDHYWHQIMLEQSDSVFENCVFEYASVGLHSHFSKLSVKNSRFVSNETGMMFKGGPVSISNTKFSKNDFGVVFNLAKGKVERSVITENEVGILVRAEEKSGMIVRDSNIYNNSRYNLKMGDFNNGETIDVRNNWWGGVNPVDTIFDDRYEPGIGSALFEPSAGKSFVVNN